MRFIVLLIGWILQRYRSLNGILFLFMLSFFVELFIDSFIYCGEQK